MEESGYELVFCVKFDVYVYCIFLWVINCGYRVVEWQLDQLLWSGWLRIIVKGQMVYIKLEDRMLGEFFVQVLVDQFFGIVVESVMDFSRYFVICIEDGNG